MAQTRKGNTWLIGAATAAITIATQGAAFAQQVADAVPVESESIVVQGEIIYRNRAVSTAPVLEYGADYFQRFEPLTVGDALKRVPSVAFLSDVLESDGVRLRGLDPAYTQIMINGEVVPGAGDGSGSFGNGSDGAFFVDRIPAELIERVEIVRSQSANRSGDAVAGAINIVLRDSYSLNGGFVRAGALYWDNDQTWGQTLGGVWGGEALGGRLLIGANMQDRHNPKDKLSQRFDEPGADLNDIEIQTDVRDGTDYSGNFSYETDALGGAFALDGFYVRTDRVQDEDSLEYEEGVIEDASLLSVNDNDVDIEQESYSLNGRYAFESFGGETRVKLGFARFTNDAFEFEDELAYDGFPALDEFESEISQTDLTDEEFKAKLEHERDFGDITLEFGVHYESKERDNLVRAADDDISGVFPNPLPWGGTLVDPADLEAVDGGDNTIERRRIDPYAMFSGDAGTVSWEAGLRYETTELTVEDRTVGATVENSYELLLPSAHINWNLTDDDRILLSAARTVRNPSFTFLSPATLEEELGDNDFLGNPLLEPETAWGLDIGYERRLGRTGVFGVNVFYRDVSDLIEVFNTEDPAAAEVEDYEDEVEEFLDANPGADETTPGYPEFDPSAFVYSARNTGDGSVWGIEFDLSAPLTVIGLENTGVFLNYSWLDSDVEDEFGSRRFNSQAESVFNVGFIQDLPTLGASFGLTYRDQGEAYSRVVAEEVTTTYSADLEFFVEKRIGDSFTIRLTGSNLLDASKDESFNKFDNAEDQFDRDFDEYELETESAGPVYQLIGRYAF
jgi:outer membrane receptor protein involved in Fe transport